MKIEVTREAHDAMHAAAATALPREACGILVGEASRITAFTETRNVHPSPETHFEIDPQALIDAHRAARAGGPQVIGYFHSHPHGDPYPSDTDRASAAGDGKIWGISSGQRMKFWQDNPDGFLALSYEVTGR